jgi:hypothetical protein
MTLLWIGLVVGTCVFGVIVAAARRRSAGGVELGTMSASWVAEQKAGEQSYYGR